MRQNLTMRAAAAMLALTAMMSAPADAALITFTETVTGSGSLGGAAFSDAMITFTQTGDTNTILTEFPSNLIQATTSTVTVAGIGTGSFAGNTLLMNFTNGQYFLFVQITPDFGPTLLSEQVLGLVNYDLRSTIGPVTGSRFLIFNPAVTFPTTAGGFDLASISGHTTFAATVPEPSSLMLCGLAGLVGLGLPALRRRMG